MFFAIDKPVLKVLLLYLYYVLRYVVKLIFNFKKYLFLEEFEKNLITI